MSDSGYGDYKTIDTAPRDGRIIVALTDIPGTWGLCRCVWKDGEWRETTHKTIMHPTHWKPQ